jgi:hypothetical protein
MLLTGHRERLAPPCLQCVLAGLPCRPALPECTRCLRRSRDGAAAGGGGVDGGVEAEAVPCLAQRPLFEEEKRTAVESGEGAVAGFRPALFTLLRAGEDDGAWARKCELEEEVGF